VRKSYAVIIDTNLDQIEIAAVAGRAVVAVVAGRAVVAVVAVVAGRAVAAASIVPIAV
jgi:hypothetical protein